jgi:hypothetical protein
VFAAAEGAEHMPRHFIRSAARVERRCAFATREVFFHNERRPGQGPRLSDASIDDIVAFLGTLTDGYDPATGTADPSRPLA